MPAPMPKPPNFSPRSSQRDTGRGNQAEALVNEALQKSNLGRHAEADALFARAGGDGRRRSGDRAAAAQLSRDAPAQPGHGRRRRWPSSTGRCRRSAPAGAVRDLVIDRPTAGRLSAESPGASRLRGQEGLTQEDKAQILDGQALQLRGTILRLQRPRRRGGRAVQPGARPSSSRSAAAGSPPPSGCARRSMASSPASPRRAATRPRPSASTRPRSPCSRPIIRAPRRCSAPRARLAGYYARTGRGRAGAAPSTARSSPPMSTAATPRRACAALLEPYFALLVRARRRPDRGRRPVHRQPDPGPARRRPDPGGAGARAFRRQRRGGAPVPPVGHPDPRHRARPGRARPARRRAPTPTAADHRADRRAARLARRSGSRTRSRPRRGSPHSRATGRCRAARSQLADLQRLLRPGEAYYKMVVVGDHAYAIFATRGAARAFRIGATPAPSSTGRSTRCARPSRWSRTTSSSPIRSTSSAPTRSIGSLFGAGRGRDRRRSRHLDLRARRGDAAAAAQPAGHGPRRDRCLSRARRRRSRRRRLRFPRHRMARPRPRHLDRGLGRAPSATSARRRRAAPAPNISASARTSRRAAIYLPGGGGTRGARRDAAGLHLVARRLEPADLGRGAGRRRRRGWPAAGRARPRSSPAPPSPTPRSSAATDLADYRILHFATHGLVDAAAARMPGAAGAC